MSQTERNRRMVMNGTVVSAGKMSMTVKVAVVSKKPHPIYGKTVSSTNHFLAHDEKGELNVGDAVTLIETRPLSKRKRHRAVRVS